MEYKSYKLMKDGQYIIVSGVCNLFDLKKNGDFLFQYFLVDDFIILFMYIFDYVEDIDVLNVNLVLVGYIYGGQVSLFKKYFLVKYFIYGNCFLIGWKENSKGILIIIINGLGILCVDVCLFIFSEVVLVVLYCVEKQKEQIVCLLIMYRVFIIGYFFLCLFVDIQWINFVVCILYFIK